MSKTERADVFQDIIMELNGEREDSARALATITSLREQVARLTAENARLKEGLEPFAIKWRGLPEHFRTDEDHRISMPIRFYHHAAAALAPEQEGPR